MDLAHFLKLRISERSVCCGPERDAALHLVELERSSAELNGVDSEEITDNELFRSR